VLRKKLFDNFNWKFRRRKNFLISENFTGKVTSICAKKRRLNKPKQFKYVTRRFMLQLALAINVHQLINKIAGSEE
jgi:hypothetical protein